MLFRLSMVLAAACYVAATQAEENLWVYGKGTDTRPEGSFELKFGNTLREGKGSGDYSFNDLRLEAEYGLTDKLTLGAEIMVFDHDYKVDDPDLNPTFETQEAEGGRFDKTQYGGYELSLKYNILSPYRDFIGLSVGLGYENRDKYRLDGSDIDQDSFVVSLFLQKDFLDDTLVTIFNLKTEFERRKSPGVLEEEIAFDASLGVSYRIAPKWFIGLEFRHQSDYLNPQEKEEAGNPGFDEQGFNLELDRSSFDLGDFRLGTQHQHANYLGPTFHYAEKNWWLTGGILWQINGGGSKFSFNKNGRNFDEHEKRHIGLFYGYEF